MRNIAGALIWRFNNRKLQILLVHQADKPKTLWSIPKGGVNPGEDVLTAARREVSEETNLQVPHLDFLGYVDYGKVKRLYCFMSRCPDQFDLKAHLPEIDKSGFYDVGIAKKMVDKRQRGLINTLQKILAFGGARREPA